MIDILQWFPPERSLFYQHKESTCETSTQKDLRQMLVCSCQWCYFCSSSIEIFGVPPRKCEWTSRFVLLFWPRSCLCVYDTCDMWHVTMCIKHGLHTLRSSFASSSLMRLKMSLSVSVGTLVSVLDLVSLRPPCSMSAGCRKLKSIYAHT